MPVNVSLSANPKPYDQYGQVRAIRCNYTGPSSYAALGDPVKKTGATATDANLFGLGVIVHVPAHFALDSTGANIRLVVYDAVNGTMRWYVPNTGAEVAAAVDLSGFVVDVMEVTGY